MIIIYNKERMKGLFVLLFSSVMIGLAVAFQPDAVMMLRRQEQQRRSTYYLSLSSSPSYGYSYQPIVSLEEEPLVAPVPEGVTSSPMVPVAPQTFDPMAAETAATSISPSSFDTKAQAILKHMKLVDQGDTGVPYLGYGTAEPPMPRRYVDIGWTAPWSVE